MSGARSPRPRPAAAVISTPPGTTPSVRSIVNESDPLNVRELHHRQPRSVIRQDGHGPGRRPAPAAVASWITRWGWTAHPGRRTLGAGQPWFARRSGRRRGGLVANFAPLPFHQRPQRLAPGQLVGRVDQHPVHVEDHTLERQCPHPALSGFPSVPVVAVATTQRHSATAAARPWGWARMAEPAASSSALARTALGAVAAEMPPWTPIITGSLCGGRAGGARPTWPPRS
jgi:hypothetical protein